MKFRKNCEIIWKDKKRIWGMPISFTRYYIVKKPDEWVKLFSDVGFLSSTVEEANIYRCYDVKLTVTLMDKIFKTGTLIVKANDDSTPEIYIRHIKNAYKVRDLISSLIEQERAKKKVGITEFH